VVDLRAGYRWGRNVVASLVAENVLDTAYRYHGSSVNGPGRGLMMDVEFGW
jgi:iron complex outermembrane receptor protein/hemoglobin/transferrin/lactoferrin receptor protein